MTASQYIRLFRGNRWYYWMWFFFDIVKWMGQHLGDLHNSVFSKWCYKIMHVEMIHSKDKVDRWVFKSETIKSSLVRFQATLQTNLEETTTLSSCDIVSKKTTHNCLPRLVRYLPLPFLTAHLCEADFLHTLQSTPYTGTGGMMEPIQEDNRPLFIRLYRDKQKYETWPTFSKTTFCFGNY